MILRGREGGGGRENLTSDPEWRFLEAPVVGVGVISTCWSFLFGWLSSSWSAARSGVGGIVGRGMVGMIEGLDGQLGMSIRVRPFGSPTAPRSLSR